MKEYLKSSLILAISAAMVVSASAEKSASTTKAPAQMSTASGKKTAAKHRSSHGGQVQSGEASSLQKETGGADQRAMREENRGRLTAARHSASPARRAAKGSRRVNHSSAAPSTGKNATLRSARQPHPKAGLKTSQLTTGKASRAETKTVSTQPDVSTTIKKHGAKAPVNNSSKDRANNSSKSPALKPNNARMF